MRVCIIDSLEDRFRVRSQQRSTGAKSIGIRCIEHDVVLHHGGQALPRVPLDGIRAYDVALLPLLSVQDVESFVRLTSAPDYRRNRCQIIAGGFGCINIYAIADRVDCAVFGRCDAGQINDVLAGNDATNVWRREADPRLESRYDLGQFRPPKLCIETGTIGCRRRCAYCQYTHIRRHDDVPYRSARNITRTDLWAVDFDRPGVHYSAIDGLTEKTRRRVSKPISDEMLARKLRGAFSDANRGRTVGVNLFNIVGYPWETPETVLRDWGNLLRLVQSLDRRTGRWRVRITIHHTPFSPEPLTPMEQCRIRVDDQFRGLLQQSYNGVDLTCKSDRFLQGPTARAKRIVVNRVSHETAPLVRQFLRDEVSLGDVRSVLDCCDRPVTYLVRPLPYKHMEDHHVSPDESNVSS